MTCTLDNEAVESISPLSAKNPENVKIVEAILPESKFLEFYPDNHRNPAYSYTNFLKAIGKYPSICAEQSLCPKILANMFGHIKQETWDLYYIEEIYRGAYCADTTPWVREAYPCVAGQLYYGRGAKVSFYQV